MLVSARIEDVDFVPTEFNQFDAGFNNIKVPILNEETGDVVFLEMGDIDFRPQFAGLPGDNFDFGEPALPEQIFLKGQEAIAIDIEKGRFFEQEIDPQMEALNQRFETLLASGASTQELDEVVFEMDRVIFEANEAAQAFEVAAFQNQFGNDFKLDVFSNEEFLQTKESFIFDTNEYSQNWKEADDQGLVPIFKLDGAINFVSKEEADIEWQIADNQYEQKFAAQFPDLYQAEKRAEELAQRADQEASLLFSRVDQAIQAGASEEEINKLYSEVDKQLDEIYSEVDKAYEEIALAEVKTEVIELGADTIIADSSREEIKIEENIKIEDPKFDVSLEEYLVTLYGKERRRELLLLESDRSTFATGTTTYADLNTRSTGTDTYTGTTTRLTVQSAGSNAASAVDSVGEVAGSFTPTHTIDFSNRTINQGITAKVQIGQAGSRSFTIDKDVDYTSASGNVTPASSFSVNSSGTVTDVASSATGDISTTVPSGDDYADGASANYFVTVESNFQNQSGVSFADTVDTTLTVQTVDGSDTNKVSGTASNGRD